MVVMPECLSQVMHFLVILIGGGTPAIGYDGVIISSERLLYIVRNVEGGREPVGVSAQRSACLNATWRRWWEPTLECLGAKRSPYLNITLA